MRFLVIVLALAFSVFAYAHENGTHSIKSNHDVKSTMDKLELAFKERKFTIFARVDHSAGATAVGLTLRPTELLIFGNPVGGTPLMQCNQQVGLDLPVKVLVWQDEKNQTWITYNEMEYIAKRYSLRECGKEFVDKISNVIELVTTVSAK